MKWNVCSYVPTYISLHFYTFAFISVELWFAKVKLSPEANPDESVPAATQIQIISRLLLFPSDFEETNLVSRWFISSESGSQGFEGSCRATQSSSRSSISSASLQTPSTEGQRTPLAEVQVSLFIYSPSYGSFHFCFSLCNQFLLCVSCCSFFRITDKLLAFDLSILILDKWCMNLLCLYRHFL